MKNKIKQNKTEPCEEDVGREEAYRRLTFFLQQPKWRLEIDMLFALLPKVSKCAKS